MEEEEEVTVAEEGVIRALSNTAETRCLTNQRRVLGVLTNKRRVSLPDSGAPGGRDGVVLGEGESEADDQTPGEDVSAAHIVRCHQQGQGLQQPHLLDVGLHQHPHGLHHVLGALAVQHLGGYEPLDHLETKIHHLRVLCLASLEQRTDLSSQK